jgi:hypothetical protein
MTSGRRRAANSLFWNILPATRRFHWINFRFPRKPKIPIDRGEGVPTYLAGFPKMALMHLALLPNIQ